MLILDIETSCDETSFAILQNKKVLSNITISQILEQQKYGGVFPALAAKLHLKNVQKVFFSSLGQGSNYSRVNWLYCLYRKTRSYNLLPNCRLFRKKKN